MSGLLERHLGFLEALRAAGLPVSLAEGLDALAALGAVEWSDRERVRAAYAATLVKRQPQRPTFDAVFDLWFPRLVGDGAVAAGRPRPGRDNAAALEELRDRLIDTLAQGEEQAAREAAAEAVARFGALPGRGPGQSSWSAHQTLSRLAPGSLTQRLIEALRAGGMDAATAEATAGRRLGGFTAKVEADARRRIAEEKGPRHVADIALRPSLDRLDFSAARQEELARMRREIYPLARRLASRLTREHRSRRRGPLDVRRTLRASIGTGGVPLETHHRRRHPRRTDLVVLCDVSGSVASFAQFTLLLVFALREQFAGVRAFTFVDQMHEVTSSFRPGADAGDVLAELAASARHAALWGRTDYGRAFRTLTESYPDVLGPRTSLLILGDARSNYSDLSLPVLREMAETVRGAWWLNPEHARSWGNGDSAAREYGEIVPMVECRNLTQLGDFVHRTLTG